MSVHLITRDGKRIGIVEDTAVGALPWFAQNVRAYSMDHATTHEGYGVETLEEVDCYDVESLINGICEYAGVTLEAVFVPFSRSRNAKPRNGSDKPWRSLNWKVTLKRHGRDVLTTDYAQGEGLAPASKKTQAQKETAARVMRLPVARAVQAMLEHEIEAGTVAKRHSWARGVSGGDRIPAPSIGDVLQSLAHDSDVLDYSGFDQWADEFGYDADSISAKATYDACLASALALRNGLGGHLLAEIRLAASFN